MLTIYKHYAAELAAATDYEVRVRVRAERKALAEIPVGDVLREHHTVKLELAEAEHTRRGL